MDRFEERRRPRDDQVQARVPRFHDDGLPAGANLQPGRYGVKALLDTRYLADGQDLYLQYLVSLYFWLLQTGCPESH